MERVKYHSELHNHDTIGSILDGFGTPKEMMDRCDELGIYGYATTNHGTEYALYYFAEIEAKYKTKTLYGIEFYECDDHTVQDPDNKYYHLLVIAKNDRGITALHELVTIAEEGKYYKPRIDLEQLKPYANDLIIGSACLASKLNRGTYEDMKRSALEYKEIFGDNFYLELQAHTSDDQIQYNKKLMKLHYDTGIPYIITSDTHYVRKEDAINHSKFININRKNADTTTVGEIYENCYLHSTDEMYEIMFKSGLTEDEITIGLQNTNHITDICNGKVKFGSPEMPEVQIPEGFKDSKEYFLHLIYQGWEKKKLEEQIKKDTRHTREDYIARLEKEINVISEMGFIDYHLIVADYCQYAKSQDIPLVPRGSGCGSLVIYLLDISDINPIKYDLLFERYLNKDRVSLPDIDVDYASDERHKVFEYIKQKYGEPYVAQIMNLSTFQPKVSIADAGKMNGISKSDVTALKEFMTGDTIDESIEINKKNPKFQELLHKHADTIALAKSFEGKVKTVGTTACFTGETLIETPNGQEQIKNIKVGDLVLTHKNRYMPVVETILTEKEDIYELRISNALPLKVTGNHPFLTRQKYFKGRNRIRCYTEPNWKTVDQLDKNDMFGIPVNTIEELPISDINLPFDNLDFWWIIGRYIGDGWIECHGKWNQKEFIICCDKTTDSELKEIESHIKDLFDYRVENARTTYKIHIKSLELYEYVQQFGKYAHGKHLTKDILNLPIPVLKVFLEGYFSADGHFNKEGFQTFKTVSKQLAINLSQCINKVYKKHCGINIIPPKVEYIEGRKVNSKEKYQCAFKYEKTKKDRSFYEDGFIWTPFQSKKQIKNSEQLYNLTVLDDSSYVANRLVVHNCGCVISSKPINSYCGMKLGESGEQLLQVDKVVCEKLGMVKMDILGTQVLSDIKKTLSLKGIKFYDFLNNLDLDDPKVFDFIEKGLHEGVFQLSGYNMSTFIQKLKPRSIEDLCVGISAYRPGSMAYVNTIADRKNGLEEVTYDHPILENRLKNSYGIAVYQEQVMQILQDIGGFTLARADLVRRGICKGHAEYVTCQRDAFIYGEVKMNNEFNNDGTNIIRTYEDVKSNNIDTNEYTIIADGAINKGIDEQIAIKIFNDLAEFAKYGFNKSHGIAYAIVTYITAYLLLYYPNEYTSVILSSSKDAIDLNKYLLQGLKMGINILNPDINNSELGFRLYNGQILYGIGSLTNLGLPKVEQIIKKRPYTSFEDFMNKNYHNIEEGELKLDKSSLVSLINSGCFDNLPMLETDTEKSTRPVLLLYVFNTITDKISKVTTTTIPEMLENTNLIDTKKYAVELEVYNLHKELKKHKLKLDLTQDDELISKVKLYYPEQVEKKNKKGEVTDVINVYEVNFDLNTFTLTKQYDKEYKKYLNNLSQDLKEHGEEYAQTVNKMRVMNAYREYVGNNSLSDLEFDATNFYFSESWLDSTSRIYHSEDFCNIQEEPPEVKWYDKKDTHLIAGVVLGKDKKHQEVFLLTHPHTFVICKLGNVYPSVANDIAKGTKLLLNGYKQGGFFRIEYRNLDGKLNNIKAIKILEK